MSKKLIDTEETNSGIRAQGYILDELNSSKEYMMNISETAIDPSIEYVGENHQHKIISGIEHQYGGRFHYQEAVVNEDVILEQPVGISSLRSNTKPILTDVSKSTISPN